MRVKLQLVMCSDDGHEETVTDIVTLKKDCQRIEHLGLTLKEAKQLLKTTQQRLLQQQVEAFLAACSTCPDAVALKPRCEGNRVIMGLYHLPSTQPAWTRREPGGAHENPKTIIRPTALDLST
jgi:hypothetical protein